MLNYRTQNTGKTVRPGDEIYIRNINDGLDRPDLAFHPYVEVADECHCVSNMAESVQNPTLAICVNAV